MSRSNPGPIQCKQVTADTTISNKAAWLWSYTIANLSGAAVTVDFYDDAAGGSTNPIERITIPANQSQAVYPNGLTANGLGIKCSLWTSITASVRWLPK